MVFAGLLWCLLRESSNGELKEMCKACEAIDDIDPSKVRVDSVYYNIINSLLGLMKEEDRDFLRTYLDSEVIKRALSK